MAENLTEVANFAAGIRDAPSFEPSSGGASRMLNYIVDADGEVLPREGYIESNAAEIHIHGDSGLDDTGGQSGPLVVIDNSHTRLFVRLPAGASWVVEQEKLFFTVPGEDTSAYWVDVSKFTVTGDDIYRWTANNNKGGDNVRPTRTHLRVKPVHGGSISATGISHPVILGLTGTPPNAQNPIEIAIHAAQNISNFKLAIKVDTQNEIDDTLELFDEDTFQVFWGVGDDNSTSSGGEGTPTVLLAGNTYVWQWAGQDGDYHSVSELAAHLASDYWAWIFGGVLGAAIDRLFIPDPPPLTTQGKGNREITQQEFERAYLELSYESGGETHKFRYYLYSHRGSAVGSQIAASLQTGLSVASSGAGNPYVAGAGAAIAAAGAAGAIISKASEGQRVKLTSLRDTPVLPAKEENGGFQVGQYVFCYTLSDEDRGIETIPSKTTEMMMFDFPSLDSSYAGRTSQRIEVRMSSSDPAKDPSWDWATHINIYAARTSNPDADNKLPQELGLEFVLIARLERSGVGNSGRTVLWTDELYYSEEGGRDDPARPLESYDNDQPLRGMENIVSYGSRIWGVNPKDNTLRYSKIGNTGYHFFPHENSLVPQSIAIDSAKTPIVHLHPAPNDSMLYVFRHDTIHFLKGQGDIRGLYTPGTPVDIDIDASARKENIGTSYPRTVTTLKDTVIFLGSDRILYQMAGTRVKPFSLSIQPHIDKYSAQELEHIVAFEYRNCYHLCLPNEVLVLDLQKGYWTMFDWGITDIYWAQGPDNALYATLEGGSLVELYQGTTDNGNTFPCEWESNPIKVPYQSVISGVHVYHDESVEGQLDVSMKVNNKDYVTRRFKPAIYNRFRQGFHARGQRMQVKITDKNDEKLRIDRIALETAQ